jgi:hypothetical protein
MIGIPYAQTVLDDRLGLVRVCPVCGEKIPESSDPTGDLTTNHYGEHYEERHDDVCVFCHSWIRQSPKDRAWEDESGACGCGDGEHLPSRAEAPFLKAVHDNPWEDAR